MKCAVYYGKHDVRIEERETPKIAHDEVLIKVKACGVCGTDVLVYDGGKGDAEMLAGTVTGHEFSGVVTAIGENVKNIKVGARVCIDPNLFCGQCYHCKNGNVHFCENMRVYGTNMDGGFAEYCKVKASNVYILGDNTTFEQGAMIEPLSCCLHALDLCGIKAGHNVVVIGGGMMGLIMLQLARIAGAAKIVLLEPTEKKRELGKKLGATAAIDSTNEDVKAKLLEYDMTHIDTVIECVGKTNTIEMAIDVAGKGATVMMYGLTNPEATVALKPYECFAKELTLKSSFINPHSMQRALDLLNSGFIDISSQICEVCALEKLPEVLAGAELRAKGKFIVCPER